MVVIFVSSRIRVPPAFALRAGVPPSVVLPMTATPLRPAEAVSEEDGLVQAIARTPMSPNSSRALNIYLMCILISLFSLFSLYRITLAC
jgi:hypothetical protein